VCNGGETCQAGLCTSGTPLNCNDSNVCTTDSCDPVAGCQNLAVPNGSSCSDGDVCNGGETCQGGVCTAGTPPNCDELPERGGAQRLVLCRRRRLQRQ
jgi:hypothetical protein